MLLWVSIAAVDLIHIRDELYALADDEEDDDHEEDGRHVRLLSRGFRTPWVSSGRPSGGEDLRAGELLVLLDIDKLPELC